MLDHKNAFVAEGHSVNTPFRPGDRVFWWKRINRLVEYPFRAAVVAVGMGLSSAEPNAAELDYNEHKRLGRPWRKMQRSKPCSVGAN